MICNFRLTIPNDSNSSPHLPQPTHSSDELSIFTSATTEYITKAVLDLPDKQCDLDPIPTYFTSKGALTTIAPIITLIINRTLSSAIFLQTIKRAIVTP